MRAVLDADGLLMGFSQDCDGPDVPDDCDLEPGKYVFDGDHFHPILSEFIGCSPAPTFIHAVIKSLTFIRDQNITQFPSDILTWLAAEEQAIKHAGRW